MEIIGAIILAVYAISVIVYAIELVKFYKSINRWNDSYNPPSFPRDVMLIVSGEERRGWCGFSGRWYVYSKKSHDPMDAVRCYPTAWRELSRSERIAK